jgi:hypothetical protein
MNMFEPGMAYWTFTQEDGQVPGYPKGITTLASADKMALDHEFIYAERPSLDPSNGDGLVVRHLITIVPTTAQLRKMIDETPEVFADLPGKVDLPGGEMSNGHRDHLHRFCSWLKKKRSTKT